VSRPDDESQTDSAWRQIVENYGERARLDDPVDVPELPARTSEPASYVTGPEEPDEVEDVPDDIPEVDRFQQPAPPPAPAPTTWQRRVAWGGVFVAPVLTVLVALLSVRLPALLGWCLVTWFVGGFLYLVATMPRTPREPWDDGSRV